MAGWVFSVPAHTAETTWDMPMEHKFFLPECIEILRDQFCVLWLFICEYQALETTRIEFLVIADPVQILEQVPASAPRDFASIPPEHRLTRSYAPTVPNQEGKKDGSR